MRDAVAAGLAGGEIAGPDQRHLSCGILVVADPIFEADAF
jgi:hypothetical protein